jgi:hypothetical protein
MRSQKDGDYTENKSLHTVSLRSLDAHYTAVKDIRSDIKFESLAIGPDPRKAK